MVVMNLILVPHIPAVFVTSLIQTDGRIKWQQPVSWFVCMCVFAVYLLYHASSPPIPCGLLFFSTFERRFLKDKHGKSRG